jgi:hypothetical protein
MPALVNVADPGLKDFIIKGMECFYRLDINYCEILFPCCSKYREYCLLECDAVQSNNNLLSDTPVSFFSTRCFSQEHKIAHDYSNDFYLKIIERKCRSVF